jgi:hypothetical protein
MGIFFDQDWFDERLKASGQTRASLAMAAGMSVEEIELVFRDQRELDTGEVHAFAQVLSADPGEVASRSGASDVPQRGGGPGLAGAAGGFAARLGERAPDPRSVQLSREAIAGLHERIDRLERLLELVLRRLDR